MTSSMVAGERRWASARRGGMTVIGKVAVPKPINLPSQRLENHGLDPNVEIVPKGTLSWGSRTSPSTSNPWGSSTHSSNADGGTSSPSHLISRPSSGGSGTRPSTAGSDRTQEPTSSAWGTSSRPSSASGPLSSNKAPSTLTRPRSAETRPGSSQLSRFAEPVSEHPAAWGATTTAERLGVVSSKNEGFSLSSGDFPTLGSDRDVSGKTTDTQDRGSYSRPSSASGKVAQPLEKITASHLDVKGGTIDSWKIDGHSAEDGPQHGMEKWQGGDPHQYLGPNVPPQHFDAWRGPPPMNAPAGLWYRGPPGGPPYGAPVPPSGFPMDPFPYFRPQIPPPALANSQPVPPQGPGSRGHHPRGGDIYRPQIADAYIRPNMPFRPGFYSGPVAFEGYYGPPPMGYCNSNEREIPLMGMPPGPPVYNRFSGPNTPDPSNTHSRIGANTKVLSEGVESAHPGDARGPYKVLLKHDAREEGETWESSAPTNGPYPDRSFQRSLQKHERGGEHDGEKDSRRTTGSGNCYPRSYDDRGGGDSSDNPKANKSSEGIINTKKVADGSWTKESDYVEASGGVPSPSSSAPLKGSTLQVTTKDSSLMQKIECLNAKVRASDGRYEAHYVSPEEDMNKLELDSKVSNSINESKGALMSSERATSGTTGNKGGQLTAAASRRAYHSVQTRNDHHGKARFISHDDGWRKRPISAESSTVASTTCLEPAFNVPACESGPHVEAIEQALTGISVSGEKESSSELHDSAHTQAQRAKMRELARQRALQLHKEEEERIKQQKAKALAKLEELDRRTQAGDALSQKAEKTALSPDATKQDLEGSSPPTKPAVSTMKAQAHNATVAAQNDVIDASERTLDKDSVHINTSVKLEFGTSDFVQSEIAIPQPQALHKHDTNRVAATHGEVTGQSDGGVVKHKRTSYIQKPHMTPKNMVTVTEVSKGYNDVNITDIPSTEAHEVGSSAESNTKAAVDSSMQQRRKGNRTNKNKQKLDAALHSPACPLPAQNDSNPSNVNTQHEKLNTSKLVLDVSSVQAEPSGNNVVQPSDQSSPSPVEEGHGRVNNQWKSQHPRRAQRNQNSSKHTDKFHGGADAVVWAPVRPSKTEDAVSDSSVPLKSDNVVQSNSKGKRAEIERYVPKPVAKELAQHGTVTQQPSGSSPGPDGTTGMADSRPENPGSSLPTGSATESFSIESGDGDSKHNNSRQGKAHGVWRQRGSAEFALDTTKNALKPDREAVKSEFKCSVEFDDGWNMPGEFEGPPNTIPVVKDEGTTGKGKRHPSKGHRNSVHDYKNSSGETHQTHSLSGAPEIDRRVGAKENRGIVNRTPPHWQPKSHMLSVNNQVAGVSTAAQDVYMEGNQGNKRDYHHEADQSASENKTVPGVPNVGNPDPRRERKPGSFRGRPYSSNQGLFVNESAPSESAEPMQERNNSGLRRNINQNNRSGRAQESFGDLGSGKDNRQHNTSSGQERRRNNMHYEYQPVGQYNNSRSNNFEEGSADGPHNVGQRHRGRGQVQSRRGGGNLHGRQGGSSRVNAGYD